MRNAMLLLFAVVVVSAGGLFARAGLNAGADGYELALWRLTLAALVLLPVATWREGSTPRLARADRVSLTVAGAFMALHFVVWLASMRYITVARSALLVSTSPLFAGLVDFFIPGRRPGARFWVGLALGALGIGLFTTPALGIATQGLLRPAWFGDLLAVGGAIFVVPYFLLSQKVQDSYGTLRTVSWIYSSAALMLWLAAAPLGEARLPSSPLIWGAVLGMAALSQLLGHTALNRSLKHFSAGQVTTAMLLEPVFAGAMAWGLFGERLGGWQMLGGVSLLIGVGIALQDRVEPVKTASVKE